MERDLIDYINFAFTIIIGISAFFIALIALKHSARPKIKVSLQNKIRQACDSEIKLIYRVTNVGYMYAKPFAIGVTVYCNFDRSFQLIRMNYGSVQEITDDEVKEGKLNLIYFKAKSINVGRS